MGQYPERPMMLLVFLHLGINEVQLLVEVPYRKHLEWYTKGQTDI